MTAWEGIWPFYFERPFDMIVDMARGLICRIHYLTCHEKMLVLKYRSVLPVSWYKDYHIHKCEKAF